MLVYPYKIRDILHGLVCITEIEKRLIDKPIFQRLRWIAQNDVANRVYPSLNTSRFEHAIGTAFIAGKAAESIITKFNAFGTRGINEKKEYLGAAGFADEDEFTQAVRIYGLVHDLGHLPLSHLFEMAFDDYAHAKGYDKDNIGSLYKIWGIKKGYEKLHEAVTAGLVDHLVKGVGINKNIKKSLGKLVTNKKLANADPLSPLKKIVDSEIDADRIDGTARDGLQAGGEYGNYDIDRICSSFNILKIEGNWDLAYSDKALNCLESLLFERYRTYRWIHFHHRVIVMKTAGRLVISRLLERNLIKTKDLDICRIEEFDDQKLWNLFRNYRPRNEANKAATKPLLSRDKNGTLALWKRRTDYEEIHRDILKKARLRYTNKNIGDYLMTYDYEKALNKELNQAGYRIEARVVSVEFKPVGRSPVFIVDDNREVKDDLFELSPTTRFLEEISEGEPGYYVTLFGVIPKKRRDKEKLKNLCREWTSSYLKENVS